MGVVSNDATAAIAAESLFFLGSGFIKKSKNDETRWDCIRTVKMIFVYLSWSVMEYEMVLLSDLTVSSDL